MPESDHFELFHMCQFIPEYAFDCVFWIKNEEREIHPEQLETFLNKFYTGGDRKLVMTNFLKRFASGSSDSLETPWQSYPAFLAQLQISGSGNTRALVARQRPNNFSIHKVSAVRLGATGQLERRLFVHRAR